jgi:hypothetical protein
MINRLLDLPGAGSRQGGNQKPSANPLAGLDLPALVEPVEKMIVNHAGVALIVAFAVGVTIACLVKRR